VVGIVDMGAGFTTMVVADGGLPRLTRVLGSGGQFVTDALVTALAMGTSEAEELKIALALHSPEVVGEEYRPASTVIVQRCQGLIESVNATFAYYAQGFGRAVEQVILTGRATQLTGLSGYLATALQLPVATGAQCLAPFITPEMDDAARTSLALPLGLAWGGLA
jgi:type IV pilus assembly protein PilM